MVVKVNLKFQNPGHFIVTSGLASPAHDHMFTGYLKLSHESGEDKKAPKLSLQLCRLLLVTQSLCSSEVCPMMVSRLVGLSPLSTCLVHFVKHVTGPFLCPVLHLVFCSPGITAAAQLIPSFLLIWSSVQKRCSWIGMPCAS